MHHPSLYCIILIFCNQSEFLLSPFGNRGVWRTANFCAFERRKIVVRVGGCVCVCLCFCVCCLCVHREQCTAEDFLAAIRDRKDQVRDAFLNASRKPSLAESAMILSEEPRTKQPCLLRRSTSSTSTSHPSRNTRTNELKVHGEGIPLLVSP